MLGAVKSFRILVFPDSSGSTPAGKYAQNSQLTFSAVDIPGVLHGSPLFFIESESRKSPRVTKSSLRGDISMHEAG